MDSRFFRLAFYMKNVSPLKSILFFASLYLCLPFSPAVLEAQNSRPDPIATLEAVEGTVEVLESGRASFLPAATGTLLHENDSVQTGANSRAAIAFKGGYFLRLGPKTIIRLEPNRPGSQRINLSTGKMYFFGREAPLSPVVDTPAATTAVRGTEFYIEASAANTEVAVLDGAVDCQNSAGSVVLKSGEKAWVEVGKAPVKGLLLNPLDAVQWAIYYPAVVSLSDLPDIMESFTENERAALFEIGRGEAGGKVPANLYGWKGAFANALAAAGQGRTAAALSIMEGYRGTSPAGFDVYKSSLYLALGLAAQAQSTLLELEKRLAPLQGPQAARLKAAIRAQAAMLALSRNDKEKARLLVTEAQSLSGRSPSSVLAGSYVSQAEFKLAAAKAELESLVLEEPANAQALARLAELEMGFGEIEAAGRHALKAVNLSPRDSYARSLAGFSELLRNRPADAQRQFEQVLKDDPAFALARFGLGLASIKRGNLAAGRRDLEAAAFLAPNVSIYRSYLGKAYFEEEREKLAGHEYQRASELDPRDPTPFLYQAFNAVSQNDPVGALSDVERAITLNNNRAVYRSSLLLDQDAAFQSASLARIFNELGFAQPARVEALKSINRDYSNYAAHLLLADSYESILYNDAAKAENRIATLLAPPTTNIIGRLEGDGSLGEYDALFDRPDSRTHAELFASSYQDIIAPAATHTRRGEDYALALSEAPLFAKGSNHGNYVRQNRVAGRGAYELGFEDRIQAGALGYYSRVFEDGQDPADQRFERYDFNAGYYHGFGPGSKLIADIGYGKDLNRRLTPEAFRDSTVFDTFAGETQELEDLLTVDERIHERVTDLRSSAQHIFDAAALSLISGVEFHATRTRRSQDAPLLADELGFLEGLDYTLQSSNGSDLTSTDLYSYATFHLPGADLTLGATYTELDVDKFLVAPYPEGQRSFSHVNPRVGILSSLSESLTLRAAYFETLRKSDDVARASIEPAEVGGINQLFNDYAGTQSRNFGLGLDYKAPASTYLGVEAVQRQLRSPWWYSEQIFNVDEDLGTIQPLVQGSSQQDLFQDQWIINSYLNKVVTERIVAALNYTYADFEFTDPATPDKTTLNKVQSTVSYFDPSGVFPFFSAIYRDQNWRQDVSGGSNFWLLDAGLGYRLPKRHGKLIFKISNLLDEDFRYRQVGFEPELFNGIGFNLIASYDF